MSSVVPVPAARDSFFDTALAVDTDKHWRALFVARLYCCVY